MNRVPLDLEGHQSRDQVVDVGWGWDEDGERVAVLVPPAAAGWRLDSLPAEDVRAEDRSETVGALGHGRAPGSDDRPRKAPDRGEERAHVDLWLARERMQHGAHREMGVNERVDLDVARALQHRRIGADVKLDRLLSGPTGSCGRLHAPVSLESRPHGQRLAFRTFLSWGAEPAHELFEELPGLGV